MNDVKQCFIMGLPNAGKTTYLAALWYFLNNATRANKMKLSTIGNGKYLSDICEKWVNVDQLDRTLRRNEESKLSIQVEDENKKVFTLNFPDLSGETFQELYQKREVSNEMMDFVRLADGILFFVNISDIIKPVCIPEIPNLDDDDDDISGEELERNLLDDPTQIQIIELLQFVQFIRQDEPLNLGIILSAWDLSKKLDVKFTPEGYLKTEMNMLWQYICSNCNIINTDIWGVSALGGELENEKLLDLNPIERVFVENNIGKEYKDITIPIYSAIGENLEKKNSN